MFDFKDENGKLLSTYTRDNFNTYGNKSQGLVVYERERWSKLSPLERSAYAGLGEDVLAAAYLTQFISAVAYNIQEGNNDFVYGDWFGSSLQGKISFDNIGSVKIGNVGIKIDHIDINATANSLIAVQYEDHTELVIEGPLKAGKVDRHNQETVVKSKNYILDFVSPKGSSEPGRISLSVTDKSMAGSKLHDENGNERIFNNPPSGLNSIIGVFNEAYNYFDRYNRTTFIQGVKYSSTFTYDFRRQWPF